MQCGSENDSMLALGVIKHSQCLNKLNALTHSDIMTIYEHIAKLLTKAHWRDYLNNV